MPDGCTDADLPTVDPDDDDVTEPWDEPTVDEPTDDDYARAEDRYLANLHGRDL
jgi:hypothetical protein